MAKYLVTYDAVIARPDKPVADASGYVATTTTYNPIELLFYVVVTAESADAVNDLVVNYTTPGFVARVTNIVELGEGVTADELASLLDPKKVLREQR
jgi:hypothetical protein